jgi:hypothetical protein
MYWRRGGRQSEQRYERLSIIEFRDESSSYDRISALRFQLATDYS